MTFQKNSIPSCTNCKHKIAGESSFCCLNIEELEEIAESKRNMTFKKGQLIFSEGNQPHGLFCIHQGKVKVHKLGDEGKDQIVRLARETSLVGYRAILSGESYYASATALEETHACFIPKSTIMNLVKNNNSFSFGLIDLLSEDLKRAEEKITNMAQKHVRERIAEAILLLKECYGFREDGETIDSNLTRKELANIAGTTTETSIRILSEFHKDGLIGLEGKNIKIVNLRKLVKTANVFD